MTDEMESQRSLSHIQPPNWRIGFLLVAIIVLFVACSLGYRYQALRAIPVYGSTGGMHVFVSRVEAATDSAGVVLPARKAELDAILAGRALIREVSPEAFRALADRSFSATDSTLGDLCEQLPLADGKVRNSPGAGSTRYELLPDVTSNSLAQLQRACVIDHDCVTYCDAKEKILGSKQCEDGNSSPPSVRTALLCSQRLLQVEGVGTQLSSGEALNELSVLIRKLKLHYPDIDESRWPQIRAFVEEYRLLIASYSEVKARMENSGLPSILPTIVASLLMVFAMIWVPLLWLPMFVSYGLLAALTGGSAHLLRHMLSEKETGNTWVRFCVGASAAAAAMLLIMAGFTIGGISGSEISRVPEPSMVVIVSAVAGAHSDRVMRFMSDLFRGFLNGASGEASNEAQVTRLPAHAADASQTASDPQSASSS